MQRGLTLIAQMVQANRRFFAQELKKIEQHALSLLALPLGPVFDSSQMAQPIPSSLPTLGSSLNSTLVVMETLLACPTGKFITPPCIPLAQA